MKKSSKSSKIKVIAHGGCKIYSVVYYIFKPFFKLQKPFYIKKYEKKLHILPVV